ncbi:hypothetical protein F4813DRAFT_388041 [Daldinia decipiens]|uniref:uncharacterized protein n=1 Tax=Daldinia decipiens TaxID=326647 RepID=UPI0020C38DB8|nr:uncharacterized protein F4813DRAFT_388041 [Daldinia decipiens]KAI1659334.1 hypothetical protein F4813DRAFT_388041 [Daldinia decipiens]
MKGSTIFLHITTILGTSRALGIPREDMSTISTGENSTYHPGAFEFDPTTASKTDPGFIIPVSHWGCTRSKMRASDMKEAVQRMINWSEAGGRVWGKSIHIELQAHAGTYLCNCKTQYLDSAPATEMWEFYERLRVYCGEGSSGWIFSKKWDKGYAINTRDHVANRHPKKLLCPLFCCN